MKGRKPTPTTLKILHGNPGKRKLPENEPKPPPKAPGMPTTMSAEAKAEWKRIVPELERIGMLTLVDRGAIATYCIAWATMIQAHQMIQKHGAVLIQADREVEDLATGDVVSIICVPVKNPWLQVLKEQAAIVRAFAAEFGLTPSSRTRISVPEPDDDDLAALLAPRRKSGTPS